MRSPITLRLPVSAGIVTAASVAVLLAAGLTPAAQASPAPQAAAPPSAHTVTLITGDQVAVHEVGGRQAAVITPRPGATSGYLTQTIGGDLYVIPMTAVPYLGSSLDRSLFDVSALIRDGITDRIPVRVKGSAPGVVDGHVTSPDAFGAALTAQVGRDARTHFAKPGPLFGTASSVRLAAAGAPRHATPHFPMHTVRILAKGLDGAPAEPYTLAVINVDDAGLFADSPPVIGGEARISVPSGHYNLAALFVGFNSAGSVTQLRLVPVDFTVAGDQTVTVDERVATSQLSVSTPRPSIVDDLGFEYNRAAATGGSLSLRQIALNAPVFVAPTPGVKVGTLNFNVETDSRSPAGVQNPYLYSLRLDQAGAILANQHLRVTPDQLATLKENYYSDMPNRVEDSTHITFLPYDTGDSEIAYPFTAPLRRTDYVIGGPDHTYVDAVSGNRGDDAAIVWDGVRTYAAGSVTSDDWLRGPLTPGVWTATDVFGGPWQAVYCAACRNGDAIHIAISPVLDSAGHYLDSQDELASRLQLFAGSDKLLDQKDNADIDDLTVPAASTGYKLVYDQTRKGSWFHQSTVSHTEWTFTSAHSGSQTVPSTWNCPFTGSGTDCSALSLLTANYQLKAGLDGTAPAGPDQLLVTFGHTKGTPNVAITSGSVQVSFDGGRHWTPTRLAALGGGRYRAQWTNPTSGRGGDVAVRVSATDAAGSTITQTTMGAFTVRAATSGSTR